MQKEMLIKKIYIFFLIIFLAISGCDEDNKVTDSNNSPGTNEVFLQNSSFNPPSKTVAAGTTIKWINKDNATHNVLSGPEGNPSGMFNSGDFGLNGEFEFTFSQPGSYVYHCSHHSGMVGTIVVQ